MEIIERNRTRINDLCDKYQIKFLAVFGSTVRDSDTGESDIDLLVSFKKPVTLFELVKIEREFSNVFNKKVDLVTRKSLHSYIKTNVEKEMTVLYGKAA